MKISLLVGLSIFIIGLPSCKKPVKTYVFVSHTYLTTPPKQSMDDRLFKVDWFKYDLLFMGGDMTRGTTKNRETLRYVDSVFNIKGMKTHWILGNHDYENPKYIEEYTGKPSFYSFNQDQTTFLILDTQIDSCHMKGEQLAMILNICDTIRQSKRLVLLHHKLLWVRDNEDLSFFKDKPNGPVCEHVWCLLKNNFYQNVYPELIKVKERGIDVYCVAGDIGLRANKFEYVTKDSIWFIASGLSGELRSDDQVLVLDNDLENNTFSWQFKQLDSLVIEQSLN